jgi:hypothetical protein
VKFIKFLIFIFIVNFIVNLDLFSTGLNLLNKNSSIKISSGSSLSLDSSLSSVNGKIIKDADAEISGSDINFSGGSFYDGASKITVDGSLNFGETKKIILNGSKSFEGKRGEVLQSIFISGLNNLLQGILFTSGDIELQDSLSSVSLAIRNRLGANINLNSGSLNLEEDLFFLDSKRIKGPGVISLKGHKLSFGATDLTWSESLFFDSALDIELNANTYLEDTWSFSGDSVLCGNANILCSLCSDGIVVRPNSHLLIRDAIIYGLSGNKIRCLTDDATITLQNVKWVQDEDFTFSRGALIILDNVEFIGKNKKFIYQSSMTSTIKENAVLALGSNFTFSYDPISGSSSLLEFEGNSSYLFLNGGALYTSYNGLNLLNGSLIVEGDSQFIIESREWVDEVIRVTYEEAGYTHTLYDYIYGLSGYLNIGNGTEVNDFKVYIHHGSVLELYDGPLFYNNILLDSFNCLNEFSALKVNDSAYLNLVETLDISPGRIFLKSSDYLNIYNDKSLIGNTFYV